jgi:hypothetical protein
MAAATATLPSQMPGLDNPQTISLNTGSASAPSVTLIKEDSINSINDFIVHQAQTIPNTPLIGYPGSELGAADFVDYTAGDLDAFADEAAKYLSQLGLRPKVRPTSLS